MTMQRIREVKWPWKDETQSGFTKVIRVHALRLHARFLSVIYVDDDLRMYFEEQEQHAIGKDRLFTIFHAHDTHFSADYEGCSYLASAPIHGNRWVAHVYEITAMPGAVLNRIQAGQSAERMARLARGRRA